MTSLDRKFRSAAMLGGHIAALTGAVWSYMFAVGGGEIDLNFTDAPTYETQISAGILTLYATAAVLYAIAYRK